MRSVTHAECRCRMTTSSMHAFVGQRLSSCATGVVARMCATVVEAVCVCGVCVCVCVCVACAHAAWYALQEMPWFTVTISTSRMMILATLAAPSSLSRLLSSLPRRRSFGNLRILKRVISSVCCWPKVPLASEVSLALVVVLPTIGPSVTKAPMIRKMVSPGNEPSKSMQNQRLRYFWRMRRLSTMMTASSTKPTRKLRMMSVRMRQRSVKA